MTAAPAVQASWFDTVSADVGFVADALTVLVVVVGFLVTRRAGLVLVLALARLRSLRGSEAARIGLAAHRRRVADGLSSAGAGASAAGDELAWLATRLAPHDDRPLGELFDPPALLRLAEAYESYAARLGARIVIRPDSVLAVQHELDLARVTGVVLRRLGADIAPAPLGTSPVAIEHRGLELSPLIVPSRASRAIGYDLVVSYRPRLLAPALGELSPLHGGVGAEFVPLPLHEPDAAALQARFRDTSATASEFDGLLPRLVSAHAEREFASGHHRIRLSLAATSYSAVVADHYSGEAQRARLTPEGAQAVRARGVSSVDVTGDRVRLMTLAMTPITSDGYLLFVGRSALAGSHEGMLGPAVSGNLELRARSGVAVDLDEFGVPDPLAALAREAREELGMQIDRSHLHAAGLVRFSGPSERGTFVLLGTTMLGETMAEVADGNRRADLVEGRWEVGTELVGLKLPTTEADLNATVSWLWNARRLTPAATAAGLTALGGLRPVPRWSAIPVDADAAEPPLRELPI